MRDPARFPPAILALAVVAAAVPALVPVVAAQDPRMLMFPYVGLLDLVCAAACLLLLRRGSSQQRLQWALFAAHFFALSVVQLVPAVRVWTGWPGALVDSRIVSVAISTATVLCLVAFTTLGRQVRVAKRTLDTGMAVILGCLLFLAVFSTRMSGFHRYYLQTSFVIGLFLAAVAQAAHMNAGTSGERMFTCMARVYLFARALLLFSNNIVNYVWLPHPHELPFDLLFGVPQVLFLLLALRTLRTLAVQRPLPAVRLAVQNLLPSMVLMGVVCLGLQVYGEHRLLAGAAMLVAVLFFTGRTHLLYQRMLLEQERLLRRAGYLEELATRDTLTGIGNRRWLQEMAAGLLTKPEPAALLLVDTDDFKSINDSFGHVAGDDVLRAIAEVLLERTAAVEDSVCARLGGDEFVALLPGVDGQRALSIADDVRASVAAMAGAPEGHTATVSVGVAACSVGAQLSAMLQMADEALYQAKEQGRNAAVLSAQDASYFTRQDHRTERRFRKDRLLPHDEAIAPEVAAP